MALTEDDYINSLRSGLARTLPREELDDILSDYAEHFSIGKSEGRNEEELYHALGSPEEVAREIKASYLVKKAERAQSAGNIWHAVMATLGLGLLNFIFVLVPFIIIVLLLSVIFVAGFAMMIGGPVLLMVSVLQQVGISISLPWSLVSPGILISAVIFFIGVVMVIVDLILAKTFYRLVLRYLKWNIRVINDGEFQEPGVHAPKTTVIRRDGATGLDLQMRFGAGDIELSPGSDENALVTLASGQGISMTPYVCTSTLHNMVKKVRVRSRHSFGSSWCMDESAFAWNITVNREVPASIAIANHAGRTRLSLGELNLSELKIRNGAGETTIDLVGYHGGSFDASIKNGVGSLVIRVPKAINLTARIQRGIGDTNVRGLMVEGDTYVTHGVRPDAPRVTFVIKQGVGSISLVAV